MFLFLPFLEFTSTNFLLSIRLPLEIEDWGRDREASIVTFANLLKIQEEEEKEFRKSYMET